MGIGITFLGTGNYQKVVYSYNNTTVETEYFPFAFCKFFNLDEIYIVLTEESKQKHFGSIENFFNAVTIPQTFARFPFLEVKIKMNYGQFSISFQTRSQKKPRFISTSLTLFALFHL